jgi:hypothetical protein
MNQYWVKTDTGKYVDLSKFMFMRIEKNARAIDPTYFYYDIVGSVSYGDMIIERYENEEEAEAALEAHIKGLNGIK